MTTTEGRKIWPPGTMKAAGNSSNPIAARKTGAAKRERRHVRMAVTQYWAAQVRANSAARGEVLEVLGQAAQNAAIPARPATRKAPASRVGSRGRTNTNGRRFWRRPSVAVTELPSRARAGDVPRKPVVGAVGRAERRARTDLRRDGRTVRRTALAHLTHRA